MGRDTHIQELMDDPNCDRTKLIRTYGQFKYVNWLFSRWGSAYKRFILPFLSDKGREYTLLDVGCGMLDVGIYLQKLALRDGFRLKVLGIDPNPIVDELMQTMPLPENVSYRSVFLFDLILENRTFDFVISNHLLHHLNEHETGIFLSEVEKTTEITAVMNDLSRSSISTYLFGLVTFPLRYHSFLHIDGIRSIRRSYTVDEIRLLSGEGWECHAMFPFRYCLQFKSNSVSDG